MEIMVHNLSNLFLQLGMAGDVATIDTFLTANRLDPGIRLPEADFWNPSQAQFLARAIADDSNWAIAADELSMRLTKISKSKV